MTLKKTYTYGDFSFKTTCKPVGNGWEVSLYCFGKPYFVGNFVHKTEARVWWSKFNREIQSFAKKYWVPETTSHQWYCHFLTNHLYKTYYSFLDKVFTTHTKNYKKACFRDVKKYNQMKKYFDPTAKYEFYKKVG